MKTAITLSVLAGVALLYLLTSASSNSALFAENYPLLLWLNLGLAVALMGLVGYQLWALRRRVKARVFGTRLTVRLLWVFGLMALVPGAAVYGMSVQFLVRSIDTWFDVRVESALDGALRLGQTVLDNLQRDLTYKAEYMALALADEPQTGKQAQLISRLREQAGVEEAALYNERGGIIAFASREGVSLQPGRPSATALRQVRLQKPYGRVESVPGRGLVLRVVVPVNVLTAAEDIRVLQLVQPVPERLAQDAQAVEAVYGDYKAVSVARVGLKRLYGLTLTLTLLLALFSALALAFVFSERLSRPLSALAKGTRAVGKGDFRPVTPARSRDELGVLTHSFNRMARQLSEARGAAEHHQQLVEQARAYLESILANLNSGVLALDAQLCVRILNHAASQILRVEAERLRASRLYEWAEQAPELRPLAFGAAAAFEQTADGEWQKQIELKRENGTQVLLMRGTRLPGADAGYVLVFDDITALIQAQRHVAWGEVARRLAHEIKNPLTPIQLSAERIQHKFATKLAPADAEVLARSTQTIVNQVAAMQSMVKAFSEYARTPTPVLERLDLNALVREVLALYEPSGVAIRTELAPDLPPVRGDKTMLRQVIHNLLQNAQDALAQEDATRAVRPQITAVTEVHGTQVTLAVSDNGPGFPESLQPRLFEPYATTKAKGTGLGLAIVKKIVDEHHGKIDVQNLTPHGARVTVALPADSKVTEAVT